jgi:anti-anti-sigma factor
MAKTTLSVRPLTSRAGLRLAGDVDFATLGKLCAALAEFDAGDDRSDVHLEMRDLHFIDAAGTRALIHRARRLDGRRIVLHDPPYSLRRIIDVLWGTPSSVPMVLS